MWLSHHQNTGLNQKKKTANKSFENMAKLEYLGVIVANQNCNNEEITTTVKTSNLIFLSLVSDAP